MYQKIAHADPGTDPGILPVCPAEHRFQPVLHLIEPDILCHRNVERLILDIFLRHVQPLQFFLGFLLIIRGDLISRQLDQADPGKDQDQNRIQGRHHPAEYQQLQRVDQDLGSGIPEFLQPVQDRELRHLPLLLYPVFLQPLIAQFQRFLYQTHGKMLHDGLADTERGHHVVKLQGTLDKDIAHNRHTYRKQHIFQRQMPLQQRYHPGGKQGDPAAARTFRPISAPVSANSFRSAFHQRERKYA